MTALKPTIGLLSAGAMGSAVAHRLTSNGYTVLTSLAGRSAGSIVRARKAGMEDVGLNEIVKRARYVISILPPSSAVTFARQIKEIISKFPVSSGSPNEVDSGEGDRPSHTTIIFADCNAVSPATVQQIATYFTEDSFIDGSIIGGPPSEPGKTPVYDPTIYVSGKQEVIERFADIMTKGGLRMGVLPAMVGEASALKMGYAGINKGLTALTTAMILATHASSPETSRALMRELSFSQPALLQRTTRMVPDMLPKAYRFVGEMEEISEFVAATGGGGASDIWMGMSKLFERVAMSLTEGGDAHKILEEFVEEAKHTLAKKNEGN